MRKLDVLAALLVVIGAINWGLVGTMNVDLVAMLFSDMTTLSKAVYTLVGIAGVYQVLFLKGIQARWNVS